MDIDTFLKLVKEVPDSKLNRTFIGALNLNQEQEETTLFIFWLCYMTEIDLETIIKKAWEHSNKFFTKEENIETEDFIFSRLKGYSSNNIDLSNLLDNIKYLKTEDKEIITNFIYKNYKLKPVFSGMNNLPFFIDKIRIYEFLFGSTNRTKLFWKINDIRNCLSHNRIDDIKYNGESLYLRETKEKIIEDYFRTADENDCSKSEIWNSLTEEEKSQIQEKNKDIKFNN